jgi:hypothetical protein
VTPSSGGTVALDVRITHGQRFSEHTITFIDFNTVAHSIAVIRLFQSRNFPHSHKSAADAHQKK